MLTATLCSGVDEAGVIKRVASIEKKSTKSTAPIAAPTVRPAVMETSLGPWEECASDVPPQAARGSLAFSGVYPRCAHAAQRAHSDQNGRRNYEFGAASFQFPSSPWTFRRGWKLETGNFKTDYYRSAS